MPDATSQTPPKPDDHAALLAAEAKELSAETSRARAARRRTDKAIEKRKRRGKSEERGQP